MARPPHLHLQTRQLLDHGSPWDAIRTYKLVFFNSKILDASVTFPISDGNPRALSVGTTPIGGSTNNSIESCTAACFAAGYPLAGVEYSDECCMLIHWDIEVDLPSDLTPFFSRLR